MISKERLSEIMEEFEDKSEPMIKLALSSCIKLYGRNRWDTMAYTDQVNSVWCWLCGWEARENIESL